MGFSGPVCDPGDTPASDDAYISRRPAPEALAGAGPTHASTGTRIPATRAASATPSWSSVPDVSSCSTTVAPSASA